MEIQTQVIESGISNITRLIDLAADAVEVRQGWVTEHAVAVLRKMLDPGFSPPSEDEALVEAECALFEIRRMSQSRATEQAVDRCIDFVRLAKRMAD